MDDHSKREVLEIFHMNEKNVITRPPFGQEFTIFS